LEAGSGHFTNARRGAIASSSTSNVHLAAGSSPRRTGCHDARTLSDRDRLALLRREMAAELKTQCPGHICLRSHGCTLAFLQCRAGQLHAATQWPQRAENSRQSLLAPATRSLYASINSVRVDAIALAAVVSRHTSSVWTRETTGWGN
jgi:hypothetical protein